MAAVSELQIAKMKDPRVPHLLFEWHPITGKVYVVELPGKWIDGQFVPAVTGTANATVLAEHCDTHGRAYGFVQTYLRGCKRGASEVLQGIPWSA
jgi:hypothetical protein